MRRLPAILLLVLFSVSLLTPLVSESQETKLPACCRRDGKHGCAMSDRDGHSSNSAIQAIRMKCPSFPSGQSAQALGMAALASPLQTLGAAQSALPFTAAQAEAHYRVSFSRCWHKRGPPSLLS